MVSETGSVEAPVISNSTAEVGVPCIRSDGPSNKVVFFLTEGRPLRVRAGDCNDSSFAKSVLSIDGVTMSVVSAEMVVIVETVVVVTNAAEVETEDGLKRLELMIASVSDLSGALESGIWSKVEPLVKFGTYTVLVDTVTTTLVDGIFVVIGPKNGDADSEPLIEAVADVGSISWVGIELKGRGRVGLGSLVAVVEASRGVVAGIDIVSADIVLLSTVGVSELDIAESLAGTVAVLAIGESSGIELTAVIEVNLISMVVGKSLAGVMLDWSLRGTLLV